MHVPTVSASLRHGITTDTSTMSLSHGAPTSRSSTPYEAEYIAFAGSCANGVLAVTLELGRHRLSYGRVRRRRVRRVEVCRRELPKDAAQLSNEMPRRLTRAMAAQKPGAPD